MRIFLLVFTLIFVTSLGALALEEDGTEATFSNAKLIINFNSATLTDLMLAEKLIKKHFGDACWYKIDAGESRTTGQGELTIITDDTVWISSNVTAGSANYVTFE